MPKKKTPPPERPKKEAPTPTLDPVLPLPFGTGIPLVRQGQGGEIFGADASVKMIELPYRAFFAIWEQVELRAAQNYPKYVGGPMNDVAQTWLEAAHAFRSAATITGDPLPILSETEAQKIRTKEAKKAKRPQTVHKVVDSPKGKVIETTATEHVEAARAEAAYLDKVCPKCGADHSAWLKKKAKDGTKVWRCGSCGNRWPRSGPGEAPTRPSEPLDGVAASNDTAKPKKRRQKTAKKA